jgi:arginyl-tRNA synthetase
LAEAVDRAFVLVTAKAPELPESERRDIATAVGLGAIRYADLAQNRSSDYIFSWDKILSFEGTPHPTSFTRFPGCARSSAKPDWSQTMRPP